MNIPCNAISLSLRRDEFIRIEHPEHVRLSPREGTLWITIDGQIRDVFLEPGESMEFDTRSPVVIGAVGGQAVATARRNCGAVRQRRDWLTPWAHGWGRSARPA